MAAIAVPLAILALLELLLRLAGFGHPTSFILSSSNHGQPTYVQNNKFGWRFFGKRMARVPDAFSIAKNKPRDTVRIFVFGESAAFGDPQPAFGLPRLLQTMLSARRPHLKFEVVNAAMTAIDSHVIVPIARDCATAGGDIWVVYMGNNEVVGPFGAGTVFGSQALPLPLVRADLALKATRIGQLMDSFGDALKRTPADKSEWGGMLMFLNQQVRADDPRMRTVYRSFAKNLSDIIAAGHDHGAGVVVSTVAVNLKDCAPLGSENRLGFGGASLEAWREKMEQGADAQAAGRWREAVADYRAAAQLDDSSADLQFRLGRCLLAAGDPAGGRRALVAARDLDTLRFRCDSRLNDLARQAAAGREKDRVLLADAEQALAAASPDGLPGWDMFYEHVHLTFHGNYILARTLAEQVEKLMPPSGAPVDWPSENQCAQRLGMTGHDLRGALTDILSRLTDPPFVNQLNHAEQVKYLTDEARAIPPATEEDDVQTVQLALRESPDDATLEMHLSGFEQAAGHADDAVAAARQAADLLPSSEDAWSQLGIACVARKNYQESVDAYRHAFALNPGDVWVLQDMAMSLTKLGRTAEALREYRRALAITPRFGLAWLGMGQILEGMGQKEKADACYQKALENRTHRAEDLAILARFCLARGWLEAAATNFNDAIRLDATDPQLALEGGRAHFLLGAELGKSRQPMLAAREFQQAVRLMPQVIEARLNLGIAYYQAGDWKDSLEQFEQIAERNPTNALAQRYLADLRQKVSR